MGYIHNLIQWIVILTSYFILGLLVCINKLVYLMINARDTIIHKPIEKDKLVKITMDEYKEEMRKRK